MCNLESEIKKIRSNFFHSNSTDLNAARREVFKTGLKTCVAFLVFPGGSKLSRGLWISHTKWETNELDVSVRGSARKISFEQLVEERWLASYPRQTELVCGNRLALSRKWQILATTISHCEAGAMGVDQ